MPDKGEINNFPMIFTCTYQKDGDIKFVKYFANKPD